MKYVIATRLELFAWGLLAVALAIGATFLSYRILVYSAWW